VEVVRGYGLIPFRERVMVWVDAELPTTLGALSSAPDASQDTEFTWLFSGRIRFKIRAILMSVFADEAPEGASAPGWRPHVEVTPARVVPGLLIYQSI
jgi:hypothetical protein